MVVVAVEVTVAVLVEVRVGQVPVGGTEGGVVIHTVRERGSLDKQDYNMLENPNRSYIHL